MKITSLQQLKDWNENPTEEKPIVLEWFLDWFFDELLMKDREEESWYAYKIMVKFTEICEKMTHDEAISRNYGNFTYYSGYSSNWANKLRKFYEKNPHYRPSTSS